MPIPSDIGPFATDIAKVKISFDRTTVSSSGGPNNEDVARESLAYDAMMERWHLPMTLGEGTIGMRAARTKYLPQEEGESEEAYNNRLERTILFGAYADTVHHIASRPFERDVVVKEGPSQLKEWQNDVDLEGTHVTTFSKRVLEMAIDRGVTHVLVDMPAVDPGLSLADERALNIRPYFVHVPPENIIFWRSQRFRGEEVLTHLRIRETVTKQYGKFGEREYERIRVFNRELAGTRRARRRNGRLRVFEGRTTWELWEKNPDTSKWSVIDQGEVSVNRIPLRTYYTRKIGFMMGRPLLEDLAWKNLEHWQSSSDQRHILHIARVPIWFGSGISDEDFKDDNGERIKVSPNVMLTARDPEAKLQIVEHSGAAIGAGRQDLRDILEQIVVLGMRPIIERPSPTPATATEAGIKSAETTSDLKAMVRDLERFIEACFDDGSEYMDMDQGCLAEIYDEFVAFDGIEISELRGAVESGLLSKETYWKELVRRGVLAPSFDAAIELVAVKKEAEEKLKQQQELQKTKQQKAPGETGSKEE
jgi:hypothetical protein